MIIAIIWFLFGFYNFFSILYTEYKTGVIRIDKVLLSLYALITGLPFTIWYYCHRNNLTLKTAIWRKKK